MVMLCFIRKSQPKITGLKYNKGMVTSFQGKLTSQMFWKEECVYHQH